MLLPEKSRRKDAPAEAGEAIQPPIPTAASVSPVRRRRRPAMIALGIALIIVCGLGAFWVVERMSTTSQVVVAAADVETGEVLTADDLTTTDVNVPANTAVTPAGDLESLVGQRAVGPIGKGTLISPSHVSGDPFPSEGTAVVGVKVSSGQIPAQDVDPGDQIEIVGTPREGDDAPTGDAPVIYGTVHAISAPSPEGDVVVDVLVREEQAATLTSLSATGRIGVVLVPEED